MFSLGRDNWIRLFVWLVVGLMIYVGYSRHHSVLTRRLTEGRDERARARGRDPCFAGLIDLHGIGQFPCGETKMNLNRTSPAWLCCVPLPIARRHESVTRWHRLVLPPRTVRVNRRAGPVSNLPAGRLAAGQTYRDCWQASTPPRLAPGARASGAEPAGIGPDQEVASRGRPRRVPVVPAYRERTG